MSHQPGLQEVDLRLVDHDDDGKHDQRGHGPLHQKGQGHADRAGGEEFSVLLPGTDAAGAVCVAEQIREAVSGIRIRRAQSEQTIASVTVSVGVAQRAPGESFDGWFERADKALYKAKNNGRNRVEKAT